MKCEFCGKEGKAYLFGKVICDSKECLEKAKKSAMSRHKNLIVAVGSTNPVKIEGTREAFEKVLGFYDVLGVDVDSKVSSHPVGLEETFKGALNRAKEAYKKISCIYSVGIEAGMIKVGNKYLDVHIAVVYDGKDITIGLSQGFEYPKIAVKRILLGEEGGKIAEELSNIKDIGKKSGFIGYLTDENITRKDLCRESVIMALIPRMRKNMSLYFEG